MRVGEGAVLEVVEQSQLLLEQDGAVEALVRALDLVQGGELFCGLALERLEQRPFDALDPAATARRALAGGVPLGAADLVDGAVQPVGSDLRSMLIESHYDRHRGLLKLHGSETPARTRTALELRRSLHTRPRQTPAAHAIYQVRPAIHGRRRATQPMQLRPHDRHRA
jgi:hypothetical protein